MSLQDKEFRDPVGSNYTLADWHGYGPLNNRKNNEYLIKKDLDKLSMSFQNKEFRDSDRQNNEFLSNEIKKDLDINKKHLINCGGFETYYQSLEDKENNGKNY